MPTTPEDARPRTHDAIADLPHQPEVLKAAKQRGVENIVHFTTMQGAVGVLAAEAVKSRKRLPKDQYLEHVYRPNAAIRKDVAWLDYVNLSIERINDWMFDASTRWHVEAGNAWVVFSFKPQILSHPGVVFTTTNNIYPTCWRAEGSFGFSRMFADSVPGRYGELHDRAGKLDAWPTDRQAEVLYPGELSCKYLQRIDVQENQVLDAIHGALDVLDLDISVRHAPEVFE